MPLNHLPSQVPGFLSHVALLVLLALSGIAATCVLIATLRLQR
jgi:hypothetical protein